MYATTECGKFPSIFYIFTIDAETSFSYQGFLMSSVSGRPSRFMRPVPGLSCRFDPVAVTAQVDNSVPTQLFELVILADSPQIPKPHLLSTDGNLHTGDLFERQIDGSYLFRGRDDDWIKSDGADLCDAKLVY